MILSHVIYLDALGYDYLASISTQNLSDYRSREV